MRKKILLLCMVSILLFGASTIFATFSLSLSPSARAKADRVYIDISSLECGKYVYEPFNRENAWNEKVLIIKQQDCTLSVFLIPTRENKFIMPERFWGNIGSLCKNFSPSVNQENRLIENGFITCHDSELEAEYIRNLKWTYSGVSKANFVVQDLYVPKIEIQGNQVIINK